MTVTGLAMAVGGHILGRYAIEADDVDAGIKTVTIAASGTPALTFALGNPAIPAFTLHQAVSVTDPAAPGYTTTLTFAVENTI